MSTVEAYPVADGRCPHCGGANRTWTPERTIKLIRNWVDKYGSPPSSHVWAKSNDEMMPFSIAVGLFGSWNNALRAAGVTPSREIWTREEIVEAIQAWARDHGGKPPTCKQWKRGSFDYPSSRNIAKKFGSWNAALDAADFFPRGASGAVYMTLESVPRGPVVNSLPLGASAGAPAGAATQPTNGGHR